MLDLLCLDAPGLSLQGQRAACLLFVTWLPAAESADVSSTTTAYRRFVLDSTDATTNAPRVREQRSSEEVQLMSCGPRAVATTLAFACTAVWALIAASGL